MVHRIPLFTHNFINSLCLYISLSPPPPPSSLNAASMCLCVRLSTGALIDLRDYILKENWLFLPQPSKYRSLQRPCSVCLFYLEKLIHQNYYPRITMYFWHNRWEQKNIRYNLWHPYLWSMGEDWKTHICGLSMWRP